MEERKNIIYLALALFVWKVSIPSFVYFYKFGFLELKYPSTELNKFYEIHNIMVLLLLGVKISWHVILFLNGEHDNDLDKLKNWLNRRNE